MSPGKMPDGQRPRGPLPELRLPVGCGTQAPKAGGEGDTAGPPALRPGHTPAQRSPSTSADPQAMRGGAESLHPRVTYQVFHFGHTLVRTAGDKKINGPCLRGACSLTGEKGHIQKHAWRP